MKGSSTQGRVLENRKIGRRNSNDRRKRLRWSSVARMLSVPAASLTILAACDSRSEQLTRPDSTDATAQKAPADCAPEASTDAAPTKTADVAPEPMPEPEVPEKVAPVPEPEPEITAYDVSRALEKGASNDGTDERDCLAYLNDTTFGGSSVKVYGKAATAITEGRRDNYLYKFYRRGSRVPFQVLKNLPRMPTSYELMKVAPRTAVAVIAMFNRPTAEVQAVYPNREERISRSDAEKLASVFLDFSKAVYGNKAMPAELDRHLARMLWNWSSAVTHLEMAEDMNFDNWQIDNIIDPVNACKFVVYSARQGHGVVGQHVDTPSREERSQFLRDVERRHCR